MKAVLLCGGFGTRLSEETDVKPKPMVEIAGHPIMWHIMNIYSYFGVNEFALALGYKGNIVKEYFLNYYSLSSDLSVDLSNGKVEHKNCINKNWKIDLIDTGPNSMTGGRLHRLQPLLQKSGTFMLTYGDGVSDVNIQELLAFHKQHGKIATVTAVRPAARFGEMLFDGDRITRFKEKPQTESGWVNGGYFVFEPSDFDYLSGDQTILEKEPLEQLANDGQLMAYKHNGFWQCMDTLRDKHTLESLCSTGMAPWVPTSLKSKYSLSVNQFEANIICEDINV